MKPTRPLTLVLLLGLLLAWVGFAPASFAQEDEPKDEGPTEEEVAAQVEKLERVLAEGAYDEKVEALTAARAFPHDDVVGVVVGALKDKAKEVRLCAVATLGYLDVDSALRELHKLPKKKANLEDEQLAIEMFRAIGRHGDKKSLKVLEDNILGSPKAVLECRILAIARIRDYESVDMLVSLMNKLRANEGGKGEPKGGREDVQHMGTFQLALHVLTGANEGTERSAWQRWWNDNKHDIEVTEEYPELERSLEVKWLEFWDETPRGREGRREGREEGEEGGGEGEGEGEGEGDGGEEGEIPGARAA
jgi:hypothetical protein